MNYSDLSVLFAGMSVSIAALFHVVGLWNAEKARRLTIATRQAEFMHDIYDKIIADEYWSRDGTSSNLSSWSTASAWSRSPKAWSSSGSRISW